MGFYRLVLISSLLVIDDVLRCSCSAVYSVSLLNKNNESSHVSAKLSLVGGGKDSLGTGGVRTGIAKHHGRYSNSDHLCQDCEE